MSATGGRYISRRPRSAAFRSSATPTATRRCIDRRRGIIATLFAFSISPSNIRSTRCRKDMAASTTTPRTIRKRPRSSERSTENCPLPQRPASRSRRRFMSVDQRKRTAGTGRVRAGQEERRRGLSLSALRGSPMNILSPVAALRPRPVHRASPILAVAATASRSSRTRPARRCRDPRSATMEAAFGASDASGAWDWKSSL